MRLLALIALFIVVPLAELYVIFTVGDAIGIWWTILLLAADSAARSAAPALPGAHRLAALQRGPDGRADATPRGPGRRGGDLRRRVPDHARVSHRHRRPGAAVAAHPRRDPARWPRRRLAKRMTAHIKWPTAAAATTTSRAPPPSTPRPTPRASSGERAGALARVLRSGARALRNRPGGHDAPVRPGRLERAPRRARDRRERREVERRAGRRLRPDAGAGERRRPAWRPGRSPVRGRGHGGHHEGELPRDAREDAQAAEVGRPRRRAQHLRGVRPRQRRAGAGASTAGRARPRRSRR